MTYTFGESAMSNMLVSQKDRIIAHINAKRYDTAQAIIDALRAFWVACDYGYKVIELEQRIHDARLDQHCRLCGARFGTLDELQEHHQRFHKM